MEEMEVRVEDVPMQEGDADSVTEEEDGEPSASDSPISHAKVTAVVGDLPHPDVTTPAVRQAARRADLKPVAADSDSNSSPERPKKKMKTPMSSDEGEDSEAERRKHVARIVAGAPSRRGGARQPIKRGGKRF